MGIDNTDDLVPLVSVDGMHTFSTQQALKVRGPVGPLVLACVRFLAPHPSFSSCLTIVVLIGIFVARRMRWTAPFDTAGKFPSCMLVLLSL